LKQQALRDALLTFERNVARTRPENFSPAVSLVGVRGKPSRSTDLALIFKQESEKAVDRLSGLDLNVKVPLINPGDRAGERKTCFML